MKTTKEMLYRLLEGLIDSRLHGEMGRDLDKVFDMFEIEVEDLASEIEDLALQMEDELLGR